MSNTLLPSSATPQEIDIDLTTARIGTVPVQINAVWSATNCPVALLPWLAWALSVESWDASWTEAQQRAAILASFGVHQHHGTKGGLTRAIEALGYTVSIVEWFTESGAPYTFRVEITVDGHFIDDTEYAVLTDLINTVKNCRSHMTSLDTVTVSPSGLFFLCAGCMSGETTEVYPAPASGTQWDSSFMPPLAETAPTFGMADLEAIFDGSRADYTAWALFCKGTVAHTTGKRYFEIYTQSTSAADDINIGVIPISADGTSSIIDAGAILFFVSGRTQGVQPGNFPADFPPASVYDIAPSATPGTYVGIMVDLDAGTVSSIWINEVWTLGTPELSPVTFTPGTAMTPCLAINGAPGAVQSGQYLLNTGQSSFNFSIPIGYEAWDT